MAGDNVYLNGKIVPRAEACIDVSDVGFIHGVSAFTTMGAFNGQVFRLDGHLDRLGETVALLGFRHDATREQLVAAVDDLLTANGLETAKVRVTLTPGPTRGDAGPTTLVTADDVPDMPDEWYTDGLTVVVSSLKQHAGDPTYGYKTGCWLPRVLGRQEAAAKGADEALWFTPDGKLAEACNCNVFLVSDGTVRTPPRDTPVLPGIIRGAVLELCDAMDVPRDAETPLTIQDVLGCDEMFLTASVSGIRPVARVERHEVGADRPGPITARVMDAYRELIATECPPPDAG